MHLGKRNNGKTRCVLFLSGWCVLAAETEGTGLCHVTRRYPTALMPRQNMPMSGTWSATPPMKIDADESVRVTGTMKVGDQSFEVDVAADPETLNSTEGMQKVDTPLELVRGDM